MSTPAFARPGPTPQRRIADRLKFLMAPPAILQTRLSKTAKIVTLIVARHTRGWDKPGQIMTREWAVIPIYVFAKACNVTPQMLRKARKEARAAGAIDYRMRPGGVWEYKLSIDYTAQAKTEVRKCNTCRQTGPMLLAQNLVCIPPLYFLQFGKHSTGAQFAVVGVIIGATMRARTGKQSELFAGEHAALEYSEIAALTGGSERHVARAIAWAVKHAGVSKKANPGRPAVYWIEPDKFSAALKALTERAPRTLTPRDEREKEFDDEPQHRATVARPTHDVELRPSNLILFPKHFALCPNCGTFGAHKRVSPEVAAQFETRAGPGPPNAPKPAPKKESVESETPDVYFDATWKLYVERSPRPVSETDRRRARAEWREHPGKEVHAYVEQQFRENGDKPRLVPNLLNILRHKYYTRTLAAPPPRPDDGTRAVWDSGVLFVARYSIEEARRALASYDLEDGVREGLLEAFPELK